MQRFNKFYFFIIILFSINSFALDNNPFLPLDKENKKPKKEDIAPPEIFPLDNEKTKKEDVAPPEILLDEHDPFLLDNTDIYIGEETLDIENTDKTELKGFFEIQAGIRTQKDQYEDTFSNGQARCRLDFIHNVNNVLLNLKADLLCDPVYDHYSVKLEHGTGFIDLRELYLQLNINEDIQLTVGRQILEWGHGDFLFVNDIFPKDYISFFTSWDKTYFKAPSDLCKFSLTNQIINVDLLYSPRFDYDRFPNGERLSYYNDFFNMTAGQNLIFETDTPDDWFEDDEFALRIYSTIGNIDVGIYAYKGMWKSPSGFEKNTGIGIFPRLNVYGFSSAAPIFNGLASFEIAYYDSKDDKYGTNPYIDNCQVRLLMGYSLNMPSNITISSQYYIEIMKDNENYMHNLRQGERPTDYGRHVISFKIEQELLENQLKFALATLYCPTDTDIFLGPYISYIYQKIWEFRAGANFMIGNEDHTNYGQFEHNSNIYIGARIKF